MSEGEQHVNQDFAKRMLDNLRAQQDKGKDFGFDAQTKPHDLSEELKQLNADLKEGINKK